MADLNQDGAMDVIVGLKDLSAIVYLGTGLSTGGALSQGVGVNLGVSTCSALVAARANADAFPDFIAISSNAEPSWSVTLNQSPTPLAVTAAPTRRIVAAGSPATFTVGVSGNMPTYQWLKDGVPLVDGINGVAGAATSTLTLNNTPFSDTGAIIECTISNICTTIKTPPVSLVILSPACQPADIAYDDGSPLPPFGVPGLASNNGVNEGDYNLFFQRFFDGCP